jgi:hypothetical protein
MLAMLMVTVIGCDSQAQTGTDRAALEVTVVAEAKKGMKDAADDGSVSDRPGYAKRQEYERVDYAKLEGVVVSLEGPLDEKKPQDVHVGFQPRALYGQAIIAARVGDRLMLHNHGDEAIAIYCVNDGNEFQLGPIEANTEQSFVTLAPGLIEVQTDVSQQPVARVYVVAAGARAQVAKAGGQIRFDDLPAGEFQVVTWHERLPGSSTPVTLKSGRVSKLTAKVGVNSLPEVPDKKK